MPTVVIILYVGAMTGDSREEDKEQRRATKSEKRPRRSREEDSTKLTRTIVRNTLVLYHFLHFRERVSRHGYIQVNGNAIQLFTPSDPHPRNIVRHMYLTFVFAPLLWSTFPPLVSGRISDSIR